jgi:hypothetical protein
MEGYAVGQRVRLISDIYDYGDEDHHPPGYIAMAGEILIVRGIDGPTMIEVSHEDVTDKTFGVYAPEIEAA